MSAFLVKNAEYRRGFLFICLAVLGYSILPLFSANLTAEGQEPHHIAFWRYAVATLFFWLIIFSMGKRSSLTAKPEKPLPTVKLLLMGILFAIAALSAFLGFERIPAGTYTIIFYTYPAMVALIMLTLGERLSHWGWIALALTIVGVVMTTPDFGTGLVGSDLIGVLLALANALLVAVYYVISGRILKGHQAMARISAWTVTGAFLFLLGISVMTGFNVPTTASTWLNFIGMALFSTIMPIFAVNMGIQKVGASHGAILGSFEPLLTSFWVTLFLSQRMEPIQWVGGIVIVISVILLQVRGRNMEVNPIPHTEDAHATV